jgi:ammonium transporter, Amt family
MVLGALAAIPSYAVIVWRPRTRVDETLDVLAAHGVAGLVGIVFIGLVAQESWNGVGDGLLYGDAEQFLWQAIAAVAAPAYAFGATYLLLKLIAACAPLRVTEREEAVGMDVISHGEEAYASGEGAILVVPEAGMSGDRLVADPAVQPT